MYRFDGKQMVKSRAEKYPFDGMNVGDSFKTELKNADDVRATAKYLTRKTGMIFRVVEFEEENYCLCGRMK